MIGKQTIELTGRVEDIWSYVPKNHLLRKIESEIEFEFIYEKVKPYYSKIGRPSIDPVLQMKMLLIGYLYGIKSERRLEEEVNVNIAYRYFCKLDFGRKAPDHSVFSQNRRRRFNNSDIIREIFIEIVKQLIDKKLVNGKTTVSDGSFIPANVSWQNREEVTTTVERSAISYLEELDTELAATVGYKKPEPITEKKTVMKSITDTECGYSNQPNKKGFGYTAQMTTDTSNGIIIGVDVFPANRREDHGILRHLRSIERTLNMKIERIGLDGGYDIGAVHRGLELLGIEGYCALREYHNNAMKKGFTYDSVKDTFVCMAGKEISFRRLVYKKKNANYFRQYAIGRKECENCINLNHCIRNQSRCLINASSFYPSFFRNMERAESESYKSIMKARSVWSEGSFSVLKREHNLNRAHKRGMERVKEECFFSALALNLKRMVRALHFSHFTIAFGPFPFANSFSGVFCLICYFRYPFIFPLSTRPFLRSSFNLSVFGHFSHSLHHTLYKLHYKNES